MWEILTMIPDNKDVDKQTQYEKRLHFVLHF